MVECDLAKVEVAGSNPVSRSKDSNGRRKRPFPFAANWLDIRCGCSLECGNAH